MGPVKKIFFYGALVRALILAGSFLLIGLALAAVISPLEFIRMQRDRHRVSDLKKLSELIELAQFKAPAAIQAEENTVYISLPDDNPNCAGWKNKNLPPLADKFSYHCSQARTYRAVNGLGWLPINFISVSAADIQELPIDPANGRQSQDLITGKKRVFFYQYIKGSFSLGAFSERPPQIDEVYSIAKKRKTVEAVLGVDSSRVGAVAGQMVAVGAIDLLNQANAPAISAADKKIEREAEQAALAEIREIISQLPAPAPETTADQTAIVVLRNMGVAAEETSAIKEALIGLKKKPAVIHIQEIEERVARIIIVSPVAEPDREFPIKPEVKSEIKPETQPESQLSLRPESDAAAASRLIPITETEQLALPIAVSDSVLTMPAEINEFLGKLPVCQFLVVGAGVKIKPADLKPVAGDGDGDGDGLSDSAELTGNLATDPTNPDSDGDCVTDRAEMIVFHSNPMRADTDGDGYSDNFEIAEYGNESLIHQSLTIAKAGETMEILSNSALTNLLLSAGYLTGDNSRFQAPAALNPFYPDKDGDGVGDLWEILFYKTDPLNSGEAMRIRE